MSAKVLSPNFGPRRDGARPDLVILHYTAMADCAEAQRVLCDPATEVSAHYLISEHGKVVSLVSEDQRAWHAGAGRWGVVTDINSHSIGIELSNTGFTPFAAAQMDALEDLLRGICDRWSIPPERVIAHSDCAPGRKIDPGARFDWRRLAVLGLAIGGDPLPPHDGSPSQDAVHRDLRAIGYTAEAPFAALLHSFRLRFHQGATGPLTSADAALARRIAHDYPVDRPSRFA